VTVFGVIVVLVAVAAVSAEHVPLWAMLVGSAAMVGAYEQTYAASPSLFLSDSPTAATTVLLAVALGVTGSMLIGEPAEERESVLRTRRPYTGPKAVDSTESVA
jgi:Na+/glutamate symporter